MNYICDVILDRQIPYAGLFILYLFFIEHTNRQWWWEKWPALQQFGPTTAKQ
jgi:hypothetical protein